MNYTKAWVTLLIPSRPPGWMLVSIWGLGITEKNILHCCLLSLLWGGNALRLSNKNRVVGVEKPEYKPQP